jgi:hypothetical protein
LPNYNKFVKKHGAECVGCELLYEIYPKLHLIIATTNILKQACLLGFFLVVLRK